MDECRFQNTEEAEHGIEIIQKRGQPQPWIVKSFSCRPLYLIWTIGQSLMK
jgi:hypothetical protein